MGEEGESPGREPDLNDAIRHYAEGRLPQAMDICQKTLTDHPDHPKALNMLGVIVYALGEAEEAVELLSRAIQVKPDYAEAHSNLGNLLRDMGRPAEAEESYRRALALKPDFADFHNNLGVALTAQGRLDDAAVSCRRAITLNPELAEAHNTLGAALHALGRWDEAAQSCRTAIAIKPDFAEAHGNLGIALKGLGLLDDAISSFQEALTIKPDFADAHSNLGHTLRERGKPDEAFICHRRAVALEPRNGLFWGRLAASLEALSFTSVDDGVLQVLLEVLEQPRVRPSFLTRPVISALRQHQDFSQILELTSSAKPQAAIDCVDAAERLSAMPLFLRIIELSTIKDLEIERMLTFLRHAMLRETMAGKMTEKGLPFSAALALQCFTNEFIYPETGEEKTAVEELSQRIGGLVEEGLDLPPSMVAALGAYRPLYGFSWAGELSQRAWAGDIRQVIERQISEPLEERSLRSQISRLTAIENAVSQSVREQYEESPYPRWIKTNLRDKGRNIGDMLPGGLFRSEPGDPPSPESPEILVAGCGTGQHALKTASRFPGARVLAVDLSLSSLSYALRKTKELEFSNVEYAQADIMELASLGRTFDLIECGGVLHHLGDPMAGWRVLVDLLRPGGLMMIGLYSEIARQSVITGRALIAEEGYESFPDDIRRCRQDIISKAEGGNPEMEKICSAGDFFSLSECRDLLFHVQEHRFSLPQIEAALEALKLEFRGFEIQNQMALRTFKETHPQKDALTSLSLWHAFELNNPDTFRGMYQFWCKKM